MFPIYWDLCQQIMGVQREFMGSINNNMIYWAHIYIYISITNNIFILVNKWVWINNSIFHHRGLKIHEQKGICGHDILYVNVYLDITM